MVYRKGNYLMKLNKKTLSEQIYQILKADILTQTFSPGEKLTLKQLQERFEVSSTPIRDALTRLTEEGLMEYYSNIGVNVVSLNREDLKELYEFMADLDSLAIRHAASHPNQEALRKELEENALASARFLQTDSRTEEDQAHWQALSDRFHLIFYDYCRNRRMCAAAERQRGQLTIFSNQYSADPAALLEIEREHQGIYRAYTDGDVELAMRRMQEHLMHSMEFALELVKD